MENKFKTVLIDVFASVFIVANIYFSEFLIKNNEFYIYLIFLALGILLYILLIYLLSNYYRKKYSQIALIDLKSEKKEHSIVNHYFFPILLFITIPWYLFYSNRYGSHYLLIAISIVIFIFYFVNLRAYFQNNHKLEVKTHFVYDLLNITNYLFTMFVLLSFHNYFGISGFLYFFDILILEIVFYFVCSIRYFEELIPKLLKVGIGLIIFNSLLIILLSFSLNKILIITLGSYVNFIILNRKYLHNGYVFNKKTILDAILIQIISTAFALIV